jgi:hypothetical protein
LLSTQWNEFADALGALRMYAGILGKGKAASSKNSLKKALMWEVVENGSRQDAPRSDPQQVGKGLGTSTNPIVLAPGEVFQQVPKEPLNNSTF